MDLFRSYIQALRALARTNQPNRAALIERNIDEYLRTDIANLRHSLERLREAIHQEEAAKRQGEDWRIAKGHVRSWLRSLRGMSKQPGWPITRRRV